MIVKPKPQETKVEFRCVHQCLDNYAIQVFYDGEPSPNWVLWVDIPAKRVCRVNGLPFAWSSSKSQAEAGAEQLNDLYKRGVIK